MAEESKHAVVRYCQKIPASDLPELLPLVHVTRTARFLPMLNDPRLKLPQKPQPKPLYFFYGRAAFAEKQNDKPTQDPGQYPVCLIAKPGEPADVYAVYPFDTGAFEDKYYSDYIGDDAGIDDYCLGNSLDILRLVVATFFGNNRNYYYGHQNKGLNFSFTDMAAERYHNLIGATGTMESDDRRYTFEVQTMKNCCIVDKTKAAPAEEKPEKKPAERSRRFNKNDRSKENWSKSYQETKGKRSEEVFAVAEQPLNIVAVVLPRKALDDPQVLSVVKEKWGAKLMFYDMTTGWSPLAFKQKIIDKVEEYFVKEGLMEPGDL